MVEFRLLAREDFVGHLVALCNHIAPDELTHKCDTPNEIYENEWERCGGCQSCLMDQIRSLVEQIKAADRKEHDEEGK